MRMSALHLPAGASLACSLLSLNTSAHTQLQVAFGEALMAATLTEPARQLRELSAGGEVPKERLKALLTQVGCCESVAFLFECCILRSREAVCLAVCGGGLHPIGQLSHRLWRLPAD